MGDLREDLIRLAEEWWAEADHLAGQADAAAAGAYQRCATALRALLASHPAPSPSVSRDAALKARGFEDVRPVGGCADALGLTPSPRSEEAESAA